jgi:hypothetical protein
MPEGEPIITELDSSDPEVKKIKVLATTAPPTPNPITARYEKFDNWSRLRRVVANFQQMEKGRWRKHPLTADHLNKAETLILKQIQDSSFSDEIRLLKDQRAISKKSILANLNPFLDQDGILRVGGRARQSVVLSEMEKHPAILPRKEHVSLLIVRHFHTKTYHQGQTTTLSAIRSAGFWIVGVNRLVRSVIHHCISCQKQRGKPMKQMMSDLPPERIEPSAPFTHIGMDCFGPFVVKDRRSEVKRWGLLITCLYSRAVHVELLESMTTDALINALRSFVCIRGPVRTIRCDRGTNFVGANNELERELREMEPGSLLETYLRDHKIEFIFNPPHASHMGGVWERQIRTIRSVLDGMPRMVKGRLDTSSLRTAFYEAMSIVNSRPISVENLSDPTAAILTPNHLITMKSQCVPPPPPGKFDSTDMYGRKQWKRVQSFAEEFWKTWKASYLNNITKRQCWTNSERNLQKDDVVLVADNNQPRNQWNVAVVEEVSTGRDGLIRRAKIRLANSLIDSRGKEIAAATVLERPIHNLIMLMPAGEASD